MKKDFEHQTEFDEPDEDEIIDPSRYEPTWLDRLLLYTAAFIAGGCIFWMLTGGKFL